MCDLTIAVRSHSHSLSLRKKEECGSRKKLQRGGGGAARQVLSFNQNISVPICFLFFNSMLAPLYLMRH